MWTRHNRADAHYFPVLELLETYNALRCLLSRVFGFSHALEFTINSHFNPDVHIAVSDVQAESLVNSGYVSDLYTHSHHYYHGGSRPTHLTGITCASLFFPSCFCRVPQDFGGSRPGLPSTLSPSLPLQTGMGNSESPFSLEWGLIAGLRGFASHGGSILSRGWLAIVVAPGYPRHQRST